MTLSDVTGLPEWLHSEKGFWERGQSLIGQGSHWLASEQAFMQPD